MAGSPQALRAAVRGDQLADQGLLLDALRSYEEALRVSPQLIEARINAGLTLSAMGKHADALAALQRATAERPTFAAAHLALGDAQRQAGDLEAAETSYRRALALEPALIGALCNLGATLRRLGRLEEAIALLERAAGLAPDTAAPWFNLGHALHDRGRIVEAEPHYRRAIALDPRNADAHTNLGAVLLHFNRHDDAITSFKRALAIRGDDAAALAHLALTLQRMGRPSEARAHLQRALAKEPESIHVKKVAAHDRLLRGDAAGAAALLEGAAARDPTPAGRAEVDGMRTNLLLYNDAISPAALVAAHRAWASAHEAPLRAAWAPHGNDRDPDRRLRVGFVSSDLRAHAVATFLLPLLAALNPAQVEAVLYANVAQPDTTSRRLEAHARWESIFGKPADEVAIKVREDAIDILIDLGGHTSSSLLLIFAHKPAPVQATWLGYAGTTGMSAIDWRISDAECDPPADDHLSSERVMRLAGFHCYAAPAEAPAVAPLPLALGDAPTFGSFNNIIKLSDACVALYARVLTAVPGARLLLKSSHLIDDALHRHHLARFAAHGIATEQVTLLPRTASAAAHLAQYGEIDIALDAVPYCGTTTTCEALWMGVPVVTLAGDRHAARVGASLLGQVGLHDFIARAPEEFVTIAGGYAARAVDLANLRAGLRARLAASPLCDAPAFARRFEAALRAMWHDWLRRETEQQ
jgi:predicted O-linked N-acetylglucosamine transferase (SPINDLY family)